MNEVVTPDATTQQPVREVFLRTPVIRPANQGATVKQEDSVMNKTEWTREECELMAKIIDYYLETRYGIKPEQPNE